MDGFHKEYSESRGLGCKLNHELFEKCISKPNTNGPAILAEIDRTFGSVDNLVSQVQDMEDMPGWAYLLKSKGSIECVFVPEERNPVLDRTGFPLMCIDLWEHAYYMQYQCNREKYIQDCFDSIDWEYVNSRYIQPKL